MFLLLELPFIKDLLNKKEEKFQNRQKTTLEVFFNILSGIISSLLALFALYLSFRCSGRFDLGQVLLALIFAPFYIVYQLATSGLCGMIPK